MNTFIQREIGLKKDLIVWVRSKIMNDKEMTYIGEFIKHNNIHQTIESLMFGTHLISILLILIYLRFAISPPDKADPIALYISLCIPVMLLVISILLRKRIFYLKEKEFGKSLYIVQITIYIYCLIIGILFVTLVVLCEYGAKKVPSAIGFTILVAGVTVASTYVRVKLNIKRGHYLHRKNIINEKIIAFISSAIGIAICIIIFQFIKMNFTGIGYGIMSIMLVTASSALSLIYYLKLKYAERYGLEEYLPTKSNPK